MDQKSGTWLSDTLLKPMNKNCLPTFYSWLLCAITSYLEHAECTFNVVHSILYKGKHISVHIFSLM